MHLFELFFPGITDAFSGICANVRKCWSLFEESVENSLTVGKWNTWMNSLNSTKKENTEC